jgi:hypothetical protein
MSKPPRPTGVALFGIWQILDGTIAILWGAVILVLTTLAGSYLAFGYSIGVLWLVLGSLTLVSGIAFFRIRSWAWTLAIVAGTINILVTAVVVFFLDGLILVAVPVALLYFILIFDAFATTSITVVVIPVVIQEMIIPTIMAYYLTRSHIRAFFRNPRG